MFRLALLIFASLNSSAVACSFAQVGAFTFTNALHAADVVVIARVGKEITPEPAPPAVDSNGLTIMTVSSFPDPKYHIGSFKEVLSGDYDEGKIIFKSGVYCGPGELQEKNSYLLFGSVALEEVPGYVGTVPVFTPYSYPYKQTIMKELGDDDRKKLRAFRKETLTCEPGDCSPQVAFAALQCPDQVSFSGQTAECTLQKGACSYKITESSCPTCSADEDCDRHLVCNPDGLCSV